MRNKILLCLLVIVLIFIISAKSHRPLFIFESKNSTFEKAVIIPNHRISYIVYGNIESREDIDFIKFNAKTGEEFYIQMDIPITRNNKEFRPYIAFLGEGISQRDDVPFKVKDNLGRIVMPPLPRMDISNDRFANISYYKGQTLRGQIPKDGNYYIAIYNALGGGKYALSIGEKKDFGIKDIAALPLTYMRIKYFFNPFKTIFILLGIILIMCGIIYLRKHRRW